MRLMLPIAVVMLIVLGQCCVFAQDDDDGWNEITNLMNNITAANQQLTRAGVQWAPGATGAGASGSEFLDAFANWCRVYAQLLQSVDGAFAPEGAANGRGYYDPFNPQAPNPLMQQLQQLQTTTPDVTRAYQNGTLFEEE